MQTKRWCVHFSDGTRLEVEADRFTQQIDGSIRLDVYLGEVGGSVKEVLRAAPGEWRYFHAIGEDGCQVDRPKYEMKRVLEGAKP